MSRASVLARGQAAAEAGMVDTCTIRRVTGTSTDDFSGVQTPTYAAVYAGKCRIRQLRALPEDHDAGEDYVLLTRRQLQLPIAAVGIRTGDVVTFTAAAHDPDLVGKVFLVRGPAEGTEITARRVEVTERLD